MHRVFTGILSVLLFSGAWAIDHEQDTAILPSISIPEVRSFALESKLAASQGRIIMLLVSQVHCPYCVLIKKDIIHPMIRGGDHADKLLIRELFIDRGDKIRDFDGKAISSMAFAKIWRQFYSHPVVSGPGRQGTDRAHDWHQHA